VNPKDIKELRREIGFVVIEEQNIFKATYPPEVVLPEIVAALLSLAHNIALSNMGIDNLQFLEACIEAAKEGSQ